MEDKEFNKPIFFKYLIRDGESISSIIDNLNHNLNRGATNVRVIFSAEGAILKPYISIDEYIEPYVNRIKELEKELNELKGEG